MGLVDDFMEIENMKTGRCLDSNPKGDVYTTLLCMPADRYEQWPAFGTFDGTNAIQTMGLQDIGTLRCLHSVNRMVDTAPASVCLSSQSENLRWVTNGLWWWRQPI
jgi:hypothetical protein